MISHIASENLEVKMSALGILPHSIWRDHILPFVGDGSYRYVAGTCRERKTMYTACFPTKQTHVISSATQAELAFQEGADRSSFFLRTARNGSLEALQWARENRCPWGCRTCYNAAHNGHLHVLQWARENGCEWDKVTCSLAAQNGHLHVLQWARINGCK
jgi:hypothetical protein